MWYIPTVLPSHCQYQNSSQASRQQTTRERSSAHSVVERGTLEYLNLGTHGSGDKTWWGASVRCLILSLTGIGGQYKSFGWADEGQALTLLLSFCVATGKGLHVSGHQGYHS